MNFKTLLFLSFGDDFNAASEYLGVSLRTIYRYYNEETRIPLMALRLLAYRATGFDLDSEPFSSWRVVRGIMTTPYGSADVFEFERYPVIRRRLYELTDTLEARDRVYSNLLSSIDSVTEEFNKIKSLRSLLRT